MTDWQLVCLAAMAVALVVMAIVQVGVVIVAARLARQVTEATQEIRREVRPLIEKAHRISDDAARAAALAAAQVERVDRLLTTTATRVDETITLVQSAIIEPVRRASAVVSAVRSVVSAFRSGPAKSHSTRDDDEALFVG